MPLQPIERNEAPFAEPFRAQDLEREMPGPNGSGTKPRAVGAPLPTGRSLHEQPGPQQVPPPGRALAAVPAPDDSQGMQRAMGVLKQAMPFVQRLLPLLDGNVLGAVANIVASRPHTPPPAPKVDLAPIEKRVAELQVQHQDLHGQLMEQNSSLKRVEDQLEMVREATDRNTLEQQELMEDMRSVGGKVTLLAWLLVALLVASVLLNLALFLHIKQVLP